MTVDRHLLGRVLPAYEIGDELGRGGFGSVVSGQHRQLDRQVAIKQLPESLAADPALRRRFTAEARALASLDHPHVVPVFDFVERDGVCLLVMELLPGGTLRRRVVAADGFTAPYAVAVSLACASGLGAAHRRGILHNQRGFVLQQAIQRGTVNVVVCRLRYQLRGLQDPEPPERQ